MAEGYILDAVRTPRGKGKKGKGALTEIHPQELLAQTLNRLVGRAEIDPETVDDVVVGVVSQVGEQGGNIARNVNDQRFNRLTFHAVDLFDNNLRLADLQLITFAAHGLDQYG